MQNRHGDFIWHELMTNDTDGAREFYSAVVGWDSEAKSAAPMNYRMISASDGRHLRLARTCRRTRRARQKAGPGAPGRLLAVTSDQFLASTNARTALAS